MTYANRFFFLLLTFTFLNQSVLASNCSDLIKMIVDDNSLQSVIKKAKRNLEVAIKQEPMPITSNINKRRLQVWTGDEGPKAFKAFLADGVKFVKTPDPNSENPVMAMRKHPGNSALLHVELPFKGERTSTKAYVSRPILDDELGVPRGDYLIGPEHKAVVWHIHGGGTPSAVAANASSKAQVYLKKGIPLVAVDQPGHGNGPTMAFISDEEIFEWNYELMKRLIHPDVDIHLQGHSWGGMFTTKMWQLSNTDKFKQIVSYQAESPGADMTLGKGSPREKIKIENEINENITDWEDRAAPSDVEFLKNTIENRKMSPVAQEYTFLTDVFYRWNHLTEAEIAQRKRINVLVGTYDGLVYVGRENIYDEYYSKIAGENYHKFTKGATFRGKNIEQGHQIFDLIDDSGEFVAYKIGTDLIKDVSGVEFAKQSDKGQTDVISILNKLFNHYSNNFAFREFLKEHTEYVEIFSGRHGELIKESQELKTYLGAIEKIQKEHQQNYAVNLNKKIAQWSSGFNVKGGVKKAKAELEVDVSAQRKKELRAYIEKVRVAEQAAKKEFNDPVYTVELEHFFEKYGSSEQGGIAQRVNDLEDVQLAQKSLQGLSKKIEKFKDDPEQVKSLEIEMAGIFERIGLQGDERTLEVVENYLKELRSPPSQIKSGAQQKDWRKTFERAQQEYKMILKGHKKRYGEAIIAASEEVEAPKGIFGRSDAEWELSVELTPERKAQLEDYINQYDAYVAGIKQEFDAQLAAKISGVKPVNGLNSVEAVEERLSEVLGLLNKRFVPKENHPKHQELKTLAENLSTLDKELFPKQADSFNATLLGVEQKLSKLKRTRSNKVGMLDKLLADVKPSATLQNALDIYQRDLQTLIDVNTRYAQKQEEFYLDLFERDAFTRENVLNIPEDLKAMAKEYEDALVVADKSAEELKLIKLSEASQGNLVSEHDPDGVKLKELLNSLLGDFKIVSGKVVPGNTGLEREILELSESQADLESKIFKVKHKIAQLEQEYLEVLSQSDIIDSFVEVKAVRVAELLNQDLDELIANLNSKDGKVNFMALKKTLLQWEELWGKINADDNYKETDFYNIDL